MRSSHITSLLENVLFGYRGPIVTLFFTVTLFMFCSALQLRVDAGFSKLLPLHHEYMKTFIEYREEFGGANRILVALIARNGNMFTPGFFNALKMATDEVFFIPGIDRAQVHSLFTPNVRFTEVVEDGISGGNVIPDDFQPTPAGLSRVRENIIKAGILGRLVANDFSGALISAQLLEFNPATGEPLDYVAVANQLEERIRKKYGGDNVDLAIDYHIIGFAKVIGDITDGAKRVVLFFGITFLITTLLVVYYAQSFRIALIPVGCSLVAVIWQLGLLPLLGFGIDPMSILVPFLIFAIGVSHGVQMISSLRMEVFAGSDCETACRKTFRRLLVPGALALASDAIGFITILLIRIEIIQEMAITASLGIAVIILTNLFLLPVLFSGLKLDKSYHAKLINRANRMLPLWGKLSVVTSPGTAATVIGISVFLFIGGFWKSLDVKIGDLHRGVPELHGDSQYNRDTEIITSHFAIGVDVISVIVETHPEGCIDHQVMDKIDQFEWYIRNVEGVQSVIALPTVAKVIHSGWNEGSLKWRVLPRNQSVLTQAVSNIPTSSGLLNSDCSVMPVLIYTTDHMAETIQKIIGKVKDFRHGHETENLRFRLATGNVGVMAATNEEVKAEQFPILIYVFTTIIVLCLITFRSVKGTLCILLPLVLVSILAYALMAVLEIGLKVDTLPVVALGVGIGVDYGIYIYSRLADNLGRGMSLTKAYQNTLETTGFGVVFTGITLAVGVMSWGFSPLKFQADMGILLTFMFLVNMLGAILLLPALACYLLKPDRPG